ncbi:hypothetical protein [Staphylococcus intermedius]|uniref:Uncharacterized protein n=1 Tax=Staphylococcus intermedius NCTC 11048 TaxID=1141106 RepID=A0A380G605_STAIN|nr:hypothetical protein [Staphylococcus intermedius]PCF63991.1 hypothetical protein B5C04_08420 [Staphylococcus intermedius]PCF78706.1 hypothetical protein B4W74_08770 [Staphylococcus intermedius]PCF79679.1 hypothetical protein B4W70_08410 [Staphylococcus intermedius]PCF85970.1 hypothetical protein B4W76_09525 [Staphylococcus intermedius]PCF89662.1 hypothetical protein B4W75_02135 [Staphylococcus intermedius]
MKSDLTPRQQKHANRSHQHPPQYEPVPSSNPKWLIAFIILIIISVVGAMIYGGYRLSQFDFQFNMAQNHTTKHHQDTQTVQVDVLSYDFSQDFMHSDRIDGYQNFHIGETRKDVEATHGPPEKTVEIDGRDAASYGDLAISYNAQHQIEHIYVTPHQVSTSQFISFHQAPNVTDGNIWYYDSRQDNPYTIKVYTQNDQVIAIENIPQI